MYVWHYLLHMFVYVRVELSQKFPEEAKLIVRQYFYCYVLFIFLIFLYVIVLFRLFSNAP